MVDEPVAHVGVGHQLPPPEQSEEREELEAAETEVMALQERVAELRDQLLRALADLDNVRRRAARELAQARAEAWAEVAADWLPVVDNLDLALTHAAADPEAIVAGVRSVRDQALAVLARLGFPRRADVGVPFDPARHEVVATVPADAPTGTVIDVVRPGYGAEDRPLRPAAVVVARAGDGGEA